MRSRRFCQLFSFDELVFFEPGNAAFIGGDGCIALRIHNAVHQFLNFLVKLEDIPAQGLLDLLHLAKPLVPLTLEDDADIVEQRFGGLHAFEQRLELAFNNITADRFAVAVTALVEAQIVGMLLARLALGPAGRQRLVAIAAGHKAAQRELGIDIGAGRNTRPLLNALLYPLIGFKRDQTFMLAFAQRYAPILEHDVSGIVWTREQTDHVFIGDAILAAGHVGGLGFKKALYFRLRIEAARGKPSQSFFNHRSQRLVTHQKIAVLCSFLIHIAERRSETPIAVQSAALHTVFGGFGDFLASVLRNGSQKVLDQLVIGAVTELHGRAFQQTANHGELCFQIPMNLHIARETVDVIDEDHNFVLPALPQKGEHLREVRPIKQAA